MKWYVEIWMLKTCPKLTLAWPAMSGAVVSTLEYLAPMVWNRGKMLLMSNHVCHAHVMCHQIEISPAEVENSVCIVKQLDSLSTSEWLEWNVSNECIPKVGACLYTNRLHQTYIMWNSCAAWWNKFGETEWHVRHESAWRNTDITLPTILVILYDTLFIP
jgi:hypothetical protein